MLDSFYRWILCWMKNDDFSTVRAFLLLLHPLHLHTSHWPYDRLFRLRWIHRQFSVYLSMLYFLQVYKFHKRTRIYTSEWKKIHTDTDVYKHVKRRKSIKTNILKWNEMKWAAVMLLKIHMLWLENVVAAFVVDVVLFRKCGKGL